MFQNKLVYVFNPGYCGADLTTEVIDENCAAVGFLGGITGNDSINGVNFYFDAMLEGLVWAN